MATDTSGFESLSRFQRIGRAVEPNGSSRCGWRSASKRKGSRTSSAFVFPDSFWPRRSSRPRWNTKRWSSYSQMFWMPARSSCHRDVPGSGRAVGAFIIASSVQCRHAANGGSAGGEARGSRPDAPGGAILGSRDQPEALQELERVASKAVRACLVGWILLAPVTQLAAIALELLHQAHDGVRLDGALSASMQTSELLRKEERGVLDGRAATGEQCVGRLAARVHGSEALLAALDGESGVLLKEAVDEAAAVIDPFEGARLQVLIIEDGLVEQSPQDVLAGALALAFFGIRPRLLEEPVRFAGESGRDRRGDELREEPLVDVKEGVPLTALRVPLLVAVTQPEHAECSQESERVDEGPALGGGRRGEAGDAVLLCAELLDQAGQRGERSLRGHVVEGGERQAEQRVAPAVERRASGSMRRARGVRYGRDLVETGESCGGFDGELPARMLREPGGQPLAVPDDRRERLRRIDGEHQRMGEQVTKGRGALGGPLRVEDRLQLAHEAPPAAARGADAASASFTSSR